MASDQGPDPLGEGCGEASPLSEAEQQVARDTEEVFQSYMYHRHQQDRADDPEMDTLSPEQGSTLTQVGCQLAIIGDDINRRYGSDIETMLRQLQPTADNAPDLFYKIACRYLAGHAGLSCCPIAARWPHSGTFPASPSPSVSARL